MGTLIAIDGLDGSGKHTQAELLSSYLLDLGVPVRKLNFPAYESEGSALVRMYLDGKLGSDPSDTGSYAASIFFAADRYISYVTDWRRDYGVEGEVIVTDRYTTANAIHQLSKLPEAEWNDFLSWLYDLEFRRLGLPAPDLVLFLEVTPSVTRSLIDSRSRETGQSKDIHELCDDFIEKSYRAGLYAADHLGWRKIPCVFGGENAQMRSREDIFEDIKAAVSDILPK